MVDQASASAADDPLVQMAAALQSICLDRDLTLSTAESCTGGLVTHLLTEIPGSSAYVRGGIVAYSDEAKERLLDVPSDVLGAHGAVSAQVARAMAEGASARFGTKLAVAITGVAGPGGGSAAKPVGLAYVAVRGPAGVDVRRFQWDGDRTSNKRASAEAALRLLLELAAEAPAREPIGSRSGQE